MGVRGLTTFMRQYQVFESKSWSTQGDGEIVPLVVDGAALVHHLLDANPSAYWLPSYRQFIEITKKMFRLFKAVGFGPIHVWMDGSVDQQKLATDLQRERAKRKRLDIMFKRLEESKRMPRRLSGMIGYCTYSAFMYALVSMMDDPDDDTGVQFQVALGEADHRIAQQASELNAYVLSNDSDFMIYDCARGWIPLDSVTISTCHDASFMKIELEGQVCNRRQLASYIGIDSQLIPLFACLSGNDYYVRGYFTQKADTSPYEYEVPNEDDGEETCIKQTYSHGLQEILSLVAFFRDHFKDCTDVTQAITTLQRLLALSCRDREALRHTIEQYNTFAIDEDNSYSRVNTHSTALMAAVERGQLARQLLDILFAQRFICTQNVDIPNNYQSWQHKSMIEIRRVVYTLLTGWYDGTVCEYRHSPVSKSCVSDNSDDAYDVDSLAVQLCNTVLNNNSNDGNDAPRMERVVVQLCSRHEISRLLFPVPRRNDSPKLDDIRMLIAETDETHKLSMIILHFFADMDAVMAAKQQPELIPVILLSRFLAVTHPRIPTVILRALAVSSIITDERMIPHIRSSSLCEDIPRFRRYVEYLSLWDGALFHLLLYMQALDMNQQIQEWKLFEKFNPIGFFYCAHAFESGRTLHWLLYRQSVDIPELLRLCGFGG